MKNASYVLVTVAIILCFYALNMDVTVEVGDGTRVNNIGLMSQQQNYVILSGFLLIAGIICARKSRRREPPKDIERLDDIESAIIYDEKEGLLIESQIKSLAVSLIDKHPRLHHSDILLVSLPTVERLAKPLPESLKKKFKSDLEKWIKFYS